MNRNAVVTLAMFFVLCFAAAASGQAPAGSRIGVINTLMFEDETAGITKYVNAIKSLNNEFAPARKELETIAARMKTIEAEADATRRNPTGANPQALQQRVDEYEKLNREYKFKEEDARTRYSRRSDAVRGPLNRSIGAALTEFAKQKGLAIVLDISRDDKGLIVAIPDEKVDITKDFITFYNARP